MQARTLKISPIHWHPIGSNMDHQRIIVDLMFMIVQSLRSFLTDDAPIAVILPEFNWMYLNLPEITYDYLRLPEFTWIYLNLPELTCIYLNLLESTWIYLY